MCAYDYERRRRDTCLHLHAQSRPYAGDQDKLIPMDRPQFSSWQRGFGVFGLSASNMGAVVRNIQRQEAHHRKMTFEQEFIALLKNTALHTIRDTYSVEILCRAYGALLLFLLLTHGD